MSGEFHKTKKPPAPSELKDAAMTVPAPGGMIRTQIYLSKPEYEYLQSEGRRRNQSMAAVLRNIVDEKMGVPESAWDRKNPLLEPPVDDPDYAARGDGVVNHDHYISGGPKKYKRVRGKWVLQPPLE